MSQAITFSSRPAQQDALSSHQKKGNLNHHQMEDLTLKCHVGVRVLKKEGCWECAKGIAFGVLSAVILVAIIVVAAKIAIFAVGLLAISQGSVLAIGLRFALGFTLGYAGAKLLLAPVLIRTLECEDRALRMFTGTRRSIF